MSDILRIDSSILGEHGHSISLTQQVSDALSQILSNTSSPGNNPGKTLSIRHRNVSQSAIPHFDGHTLAQLQSQEAELADTLIDELERASTVVIGAPMYNFGMPSQLKSWFDHVARAGRTFKYTDTGPVGLLKDKRVIVITTRGSQHKGTPRDSMTVHIRSILGLLGLDSDVHFIYVEGLNQSALKQKALDDAQKHIQTLLTHIENSTQKEGATA